jgi:hypothetical protein
MPVKIPKRYQIKKDISSNIYILVEEVRDVAQGY